MAPNRLPSSRDYLVITRPAFSVHDGRWEPRWMWKITRRSKPLGVRLQGENFNSQLSAQSAGQKALKSLLADLPKEERNG